MLIRKEPGNESWTGERCYIREILNDPRVPEVSLAETRVEPGVTTELHRLTVAEWYVIREGTGLMEVGEAEPFEVVPGDVVAIPQHVSQRIRNTGPTALRFECICVPRFTPGCYQSLEADQESAR